MDLMESENQSGENIAADTLDAVDGVLSEENYGAEAEIPQAPEQSYPPQQEVPYDPHAWIYDTTDVNKYTENLLREIGGNYARTAAEREIADLVKATDWAARRIHTGRDGLPSYDSVVGNEVAAFARQRPEVVTWLQAQPNPAEAAFFFGCLLRYPHLSDVLRSQGIDVFYQQVRQQVSGNVVRPSVRPRSLQGGHSLLAPRKLTAAQIEAMDSAAFELELDRFKQRGF
jgi:hypothetical protein